MYDDDNIEKLETEHRPLTENEVGPKKSEEPTDKRSRSNRRRKRDHKYYQDLKDGKLGVKSMTEFEKVSKSWEYWSKMGQEIETPWMAELYSLLSKYTFEQRKVKAARHFKDALHIRKTRHDIESKHKSIDFK